MHSRFVRKVALTGIIIFALAGPGTSRGQQQYTVDPGWDLLETYAPGTEAFGINFEGVPLGTYNFGGSIGVQNVGNTDTIIQRNGPVVGSAGSTNAFTGALVALQLQSVNQVSLGGGPVGYYYITLQSTDNTGPASPDSGLVYFDPDNTGGWFTDVLDVYFDVHYGALNGPIVYQGSEILSNNAASNGGAPTQWTHLPNPAVGPEIQGVDYLLDGTDTSGDFWPTSDDTHVGPPGYEHTFIVPEPSTFTLLGIGAIGLLAYEWRRRKAKA
jgi:hypothetical protein